VAKKGVFNTPLLFVSAGQAQGIVATVPVIADLFRNDGYKRTILNFNNTEKLL